MAKSRREKLGQVTTVREFTGGWNVVDNEFNMLPKYARVMRNVVRQSDGTIGPRWGTRLFCDIAAFDVGDIIGMDYFGSHLIVATTEGNLVGIDGQGTAYLIWSEAISHGLAGSPHSWRHDIDPSKSFVSFTQFKSHLIVANGVDKPLKVNSSLNVEYLADLATGSNIYTPIARYSAAAAGESYGYLVFAGDPLEPSLLHIGAADALGTFYGDPAPNDAVQFDLGSKVPAGNSTIRGLRFFRDRLLVAFDEVVIAVQLGQYNATNDHTPLVTDIIEASGSFSHRTMYPVGADMFMADYQGVPFVTRAKLSTSLIGDRVSDLIQTEWQQSVQSLSVAAVEDRVFAVQNHNEDQYMLFVPNHSDRARTTETRGFVFTAGKQGAWAEMTQWNWHAGCHSLQNNIFFARDTQVYLYGNDSTPIYRDFEIDQETFDDDTEFTDHTGFYPVADEQDSGLPITWAWELPWADFNQRMHLKRSLFFSVDSTGPSPFTVKMFADNVYYDFTDPGEEFSDDTLFDDDLGFLREDPLLLPVLEQEFVGGSRGGFGIDGFGTYFGGGHRSDHPKLYRWPARFKIAKFRFEGSTMDEFAIASFSITYLLGGLRR